MIRILKNGLPFLVWYALTFYLSSRPGGGLSLFPFSNFDKFLHFTWYFILGLFLARSVYAQNRFLRLRWRWAVLVLLSAPLFAFTDEWHQSFVPGRDVSVLDGLCDVLGMAFAVMMFGLKKNVFELKRKIALTELREKQVWYRLYLLAPVFVLLAFDFYYGRQELVSSRLGDLLGRERAAFLFSAASWFVMALLWARFWIWELWWRSSLHKRALWVFGVLLFAVPLIFNALSSSPENIYEHTFRLLLVYGLGFALYAGGFAWVQKQKKWLFPDPHKGCRD